MFCFMKQNIQMSYVLRSKLPSYVVDYIKLYTGEGIWRNNKYINIHRIARDDLRYSMLKRLPKIRQVINRFSLNDHQLRGCTWFKVDGKKHMVISVKYDRYYDLPYTENYYWEMCYNEKKIMVPIR